MPGFLLFSQGGHIFKTPEPHPYWNGMWELLIGLVKVGSNSKLEGQSESIKPDWDSAHILGIYESKIDNW